MEQLFTKAQIEKTEKGMLAVASSNVEDRQGEVVSVDGWDTKNFKKNPVLLWAHDHEIPAIGTAKGLKVDGVGKKARLVFEPVFHDFTPEAKAIKTMFENGILNSFSVGFRPLDMEGNTYTSQELLEISAVNVPANPEARMLAYKSLKDAGFKNKTIKELGIEVTEEQEKDLKIEKLENEVKVLNEKYDDVVKGLKNLNPVGRDSSIAKDRASMLKMIARATDNMLEKKAELPKEAVTMAQVSKRAVEKLIVLNKQEIKSSGKN